MSTAVGAKAVLKVGDSANTLQDVSAYLTDSGLTRSIDSLESTTFGKTAHTYKAGLTDSQFTLSGDWDPAVDAILAGIIGLDGRSFEYYPQGLGTGNIKYSGTCLMTKYETQDAVAALGTFTADFQGSDTVTRSVL